MAQQESLQTELSSSQLSGRRKRVSCTIHEQFATSEVCMRTDDAQCVPQEIGRDLKRLETEQTELQQEARRELLQSNDANKAKAHSR